MDGAIGRPSFNGNSIYYSKRSKYGNKYGSRFFDIYEFDLEKKLKLEKLKTLEHLTQYFAPKTVRFIISLLSMGQIIFLKLI